MLVYRPLVKYYIYLECKMLYFVKEKEKYIKTNTTKIFLLYINNVSEAFAIERLQFSILIKVQSFSDKHH